MLWSYTYMQNFRKKVVNGYSELASDELTNESDFIGPSNCVGDQHMVRWNLYFEWLQVISFTQGCKLFKMKRIFANVYRHSSGKPKTFNKQINKA